MLWGALPRGARIGRVVPEPVSSPGRRTTEGDRQPVLNGRKRITSAFAALAVGGAVALTAAGSPSAQAEPDLGTAKERVERLMHEAEQASERYNDARLELAGLTADLASLESDQGRQGDVLASVRHDVRDSVITQYQGQSLGAAGELLSSDSDAFLTQLSTVSTVNDLQSSLLSSYSDELKAYEIRKEQTSKRRDQITELKADLAAEKETADTKLAAAEKILDELEAKQREAILSGDPVDAPANIDASGRAAIAIRYAMAQVGKAYVYGAAGPNAFDCSGLTMMAWGQAGVALPHSSSAQFNTGTRVAEGDLKPGDLVFYYSPISHVGMYIGNGLIVHAANPGAGVKVSPLHEMPYVGAVRPG